MRLSELVYRSLGFRFQNLSTWFNSNDIFRKYGNLTIRKGSSDIRVFKQIFLDQVYFVFPGKFKPKVIVDAGANVGYSAVWFSEGFPEAKILAIEPEKNNFEILSENTRNRKNIIPIYAGLWNEKALLKISNPKADSWGFITEVSNKIGEKTIETVTLPQLIADYSIEQIDLLKIDIEGAEYELFEKGTENWLPKVKMIMIEIHDQFRPGCSELIDQKVFSFGFLKLVTKELTVYYKQ